MKDIKDSCVLMLCLYFNHRPRGFHAIINYEVIKAPSDGHCMIHAWRIALENSREIRNKPTYTQLCESVRDEFMKNINHYSKFVPDTTNFTEEVLKYLEDKNYASDIGDLVLPALANVTKTFAMIYTEEEVGKTVQSSSIEPINGQSKGRINLLKRGQHYDAIVLASRGEPT